MSDINNISLLDLLPPNMVNDVNVIEATKAIDHQLQTINNNIAHLIFLPNIDQLDSDTLDLLAIQFIPPFYDQSLDISIKREMIKNSINWHKRKGTVAALEEVVSTIFNGEAKIVEWYEYGGQPHHFKIVTTHIGTDTSLINEFKKVAEMVKRKSSVLEEVVVLISNTFSMYYGFVMHTGDKIIIRQEG